ncbi:histidine kinase [Flavobacterium sp.]|uniref:tetratricopeptide repeat-containing sensor histidine kinase n=1 Tax=Flavobacterium sp. TaxID=239 RepID=UPI001203B071|nr:histidine kinase [Flavobacterium sp.]RZJ70301.1 MAG: hypothetical protein EOO49_14315 [Flavobacterium sp.]
MADSAKIMLSLLLLLPFFGALAQHPETDISRLQSLNESAAKKCTKQPDEALVLLEASEVLANRIGNDRDKAEIYTIRGCSYLFKNDFPKGKRSYEKALSLYEKLEDDDQIANTLDNLGLIEIHLRQFQAATDHFEKAIWKHIVLGRKSDLAYDYLRKANAYLGLGDFREAWTTIRLADAVIEDIVPNRNLEHYRNETKSAATAKTDSVFAVYQTMLPERKPSDSAYEEEALSIVNRIKSRVQDKTKLAESEKRESMLQSQKDVFIVIFLLLAILLVVLIFTFRLRRVKMQNRQLLTEQKLLRSQMNPHFIFNSVSNVQGLIRDGQSDEAIDYLTRFSKLTRQILESSNESHIALEEEIEMLENYCSVQRLLYNGNFEYEVSASEDLDTESIFIAPMLTQPFVENAIKHGIANRSQTGSVKISFFLKNAKLFVEITDNGKGFNQKNLQSKHKSLSIAITKNRLIHLGKGRQLAFEAKNLTDETGAIKGAKVTFEIPHIVET